MVLMRISYRDCSRCGVRFRPTPSALERSDYWCPRCHYLAKQESRKKAAINKSYVEIIEMQKYQIETLQRKIDALESRKKEQWKCSKCKTWFTPGAKNLKDGRYICGPCQYRAAKKRKKVYAATRREMVNSGAVSGTKICTKCGESFEPTPGQLRHSNYICRPCRAMARRKG